MALQGTLDTFALPDVLRLLSATRKSGELRIEGSRGTGAVGVAVGEVTTIAAHQAPLAAEPVDALFELLRFEDGSFTFDAEASVGAEARHDVEALLAEAEALLAEWREIEAVVPSLASWVAMCAELPGAKVTLDQETWTTLVAVGSGSTVAGIGERLGLPELPVSRAVRRLVEQGLVTVEARVDEPVAPAPVPEVEAGATAEPAEEQPVEDQGDDDGTIPGPKAKRPRAKRLHASTDEPQTFVPLDLSALHQTAVTAEPTDELETASQSDLAAAFPGLAGHGAVQLAVEPEAEDENETDRQLANLSPRAADAVRAAGMAGSDDEVEGGGEDGDDGDEPLNRGLLLKFLSSVKS